MSEETQIAEKPETPGYLRAIYGAERHFNELVESTGISLKFKEEALHARIACEANDFLLKTAAENMLSLQKAIYSVATIGLSLNRATAYAYLVPRKGEVCLDVSYRGLVKIATDTGSVRWAKAEVVHENDRFTMRQMGEQPIHEFNPFGDRGKPVGVYCVAKTSDGDYLADAMSMEEIHKIRDKSDNAKSKYSAWQTFPEEMWKKSIIKRASKSWPKTERSERLQHAIEVINQHEGIDFTAQHTPDQYGYYLETVEAGKERPLDHYALIQSLEYEERASIGSHHIKQIDRGGKGKERERIEAIYKKGESLFMDIQTIIEESEDETEISETIDGLSPDAMALLMDRVRPEALSRLQQISEAA